MTWLIIYLSILASSQASPWDSLSAKIAVVEYNPVLQTDELSASQAVTENTGKYIEKLQAITDLDLVVFPEDTLRTNHETATEIHTEIPCNLTTYPQFMKDLSCAARDSKTYIVVNLVEKLKCDQKADIKNQNCKNEGFYFYNTDVVFDRSGKIINSYRKYNLFGENTMDRSATAEEVVIKTDFGVNFGIFTCFDLLFKSPAQDLLKKNIDGVIFPTMWFSELPFLTAVQAQQMWAHAHDVTFFSAGANNPAVGSGGTGVYRGAKGLLVGGYVAEGGSQTFVYDSIDGKVLPPAPVQDVDALSKAMDNFYLITDDSIQDYNSIVLDPSIPDHHSQTCYDDGQNIRFCCHFNIQLSLGTLKPDLQTYTYHLVAFSGVRSFTGVYNGGTDVCAIIACLNSSLSSCGKRFPKYEDVYWPVTFEAITINATFDNTENKIQFPNSLLSSIRPIDPSETAWASKEVEGNNLVEKTFSITKPQNRLLTFAIYGRNFEKDGPNGPGDDNSSGTFRGVTCWLIISCWLVLTAVTRN